MRQDSLTSIAIRSVLQGVTPRMTEYHACLNMRRKGFPQSTHINICAGPRAKYGLLNTSMQVVERGDPMVVGCDLMGAQNCRAGFMALADAPTRRDLESHCPEAWSRIQARRDVMRNTLGIAVRDEVLPLSSVAAWLPPFWLAQHRAMVMVPA